MATGFGSRTPSSRVRAAQLALAQLVRRVAPSGFAAMRARPGLTAQVDQHAAAVRDTLTVDGRISPVGLAAYAAGVYETAAQHGWQLPAGAGRMDWSTPAWPLLRLLAVCTLADPTGAP